MRGPKVIMQPSLAVTFRLRGDNLPQAEAFIEELSQTLERVTKQWARQHRHRVYLDWSRVDRLIKP